MNFSKNPPLRANLNNFKYLITLNELKDEFASLLLILT